VIFEQIVNRWSKLPESRISIKGPDIIAPLGYGLLPDDLPLATVANLEKAVLARKRFRRALIVFGNSSHCFPGSEVVEGRLKHNLLVQYDVPLGTFLDVGPITNTVTEAEKIRDAVRAKGIEPKEIILITG